MIYLNVHGMAEKLRGRILQAGDTSEQWLLNRYSLPHDYFNRCRITVSKAACRSSFNRPMASMEHPSSDRKSREYIVIHLRGETWHTYKKKTVGLYADGIPASQDIRVTLFLIHEMTHYIQYIQHRKYSEVETTQNEIDFVKENHPDLYTQLKQI